MPHPAISGKSRKDCDGDFKVSLEAGFDDLRSLLWQLHVSELDALRKDNEQLRSELDMRMRTSAVLATVKTKGDATSDAKQLTVEEVYKSDPQVEHVNGASNPEKLESSVEDDPERKAMCLSDSIVATGTDMTNGDILPVNSLLHFHMKKIWLSLVEEGLQSSTLASFQNMNKTFTEAAFEQVSGNGMAKRISVQSFAVSLPLGSKLSNGSNWISQTSAWLSRFMMYPTSPIRLAWAFFSLLLLSYDFFIIPYTVSFEVDDIDFDDAMQLASCVFWSCDMIVTVFTGFYIDFHLIMDPKHSLINYTRSWLVFDVCLVSLDWSVLFLQNIQEAAVISMFRGVRVLRIMRMLRLVRVARVAAFRSLVNDVLVVTPDVLHGIVRFMNVLVFILTFVHLGACFWAIVGKADGGWIEASHMESDSAIYKYAISMHWVASALQGSRQSVVVVHRAAELFIDSSIMILGFVLTSLFIGTITFAVLANSESDTSKVARMAKRYLRAHNCSAATRIKTHRFLQSHNIDGPAELIAYETQLFRAFPVRLQEDLHYESRFPRLCKLSNFSTLHELSSRCVRQLCNEMFSKLAAEGESVFSTGDACNQIYMIREGMFKYKCAEDVLAATPRQGVFPRLADSMPGCDILHRGQVLCEASFWTDWENVGEFGAMDKFGLLLVFDADKFAHVVLQYRVGRIHASKYSHHFVWRLNRCVSCDLTGFDFEMSELDTPAYSGTPESHFAFISHYKVESGTEATLMRDLMLSLIKADVTHEANEYMSAVFVDSEDLVDLERLEAHVQGSNSIVILLTPGLLSRPWCLLEFVTAVRNNVTIVPVEIQRPGLKYVYPSEEWYASLRRGEAISKDSLDLLVGMGVTIAEVESAVRHVFLKIALPFSPHKSGTVRAAEMEDIMKRCYNEKRKIYSSSGSFS